MALLFKLRKYANISLRMNFISSFQSKSYFFYFAANFIIWWQQQQKQRRRRSPPITKRSHRRSNQNVSKNSPNILITYKFMCCIAMRWISIHTHPSSYSRFSLKLCGDIFLCHDDPECLLWPFRQYKITWFPKRISRRFVSFPPTIYIRT